MRELENALTRAVSSCSGAVLQEEDLDIVTQDYEDYSLESLEDALRREVRRLIEGGERNIYYTLYG